MTTAQQQQRDTITENFEGTKSFYWDIGSDGKTKINFGYGYNLTDNSNWATVLSKAGIPASAISDITAAVDNTHSTVNMTTINSSIASANNDLSTITASTLQSIKQTLMDNFFTNTVDSVVNYNLPTG